MNIISDSVSNLVFVALILLIGLIIVMIFMLWKMNRYFNDFMNQNAQDSKYLQEILFAFGDDTVDTIKAMNVSVSGQIQAMKNEMLKQISVSAQKISGENSQALSELGTRINFESLNRNMQAILKAHEDYRTEVAEELKQIISSLSMVNEIRGNLDNVSNNIALLNGNVQKSFEALQERIQSISDINRRLDKIINIIGSLSNNIGTAGTPEELTKEQAEAISDLKASIDNLAKFAADMQGAITMHNGSIQSTFVKTEDSLRRLIMSVTDRIEKDYRDNLEVMFKAMDKNLRAILDRLIDDIDGKKGKSKK